MSYEKKAGPPLVIRFYYETDTIFKEVSRKSSFKAQAIAKADGETPDFDKIQLTADEKDLMRDFLREGMLEVFAELFKIISGDSVEHDVSFTLEGGGNVTGSYADIVDNAKYRTINLDLIDQKIRNALVDFVLFKWYALKGLSEDAKLHFEEFKQNRLAVVQKSIALRQPV